MTAVRSERSGSIEAAHTTGQVRIDPRAATRVVIGENDTIATTGCQGDLRDQWEANAAFIVLAWNSHDELLAALKSAEAAFRMLRFNRDREPQFAEAIDHVRAAIARAEGTP